VKRGVRLVEYARAAGNDLRPYRDGLVSYRRGVGGRGGALGETGIAGATRSNQKAGGADREQVEAEAGGKTPS